MLSLRVLSVQDGWLTGVFATYCHSNSYVIDTPVAMALCMSKKPTTEMGLSRVTQSSIRVRHLPRRGTGVSVVVAKAFDRLGIRREGDRPATYIEDDSFDDVG